jgi:hypothetical protein
VAARSRDLVQRAALALSLALACGVGDVGAQNKLPEGLQPIPEVDSSTLPPGIGEEGKPLVTVRRQDGAEFKEYHVRGSVIAIKVTPKVGPVYWLIQRDGNLVRHDAPGPNLTVPSWLVLEW